MKKNRSTPKETAINALKLAEEASLKEQDGYRDIIEKNRVSGLTGPHKPDLNKQGWQQVLALMKGCAYPPEPGERESFLNINFDHTLNKIKLEKITDRDIRSDTYFLNELVEHTQRLHCMAVFIERVGHLGGLGSGVLSFWTKRASLTIIHGEAVEMGKVEEAESIACFIKGIDIIADALVEVWGDQAAEENMMIMVREALGELFGEGLERVATING